MLWFGWLLDLCAKGTCKLITNFRIKENKSFTVGPEYLTIAVTAVVSAVTGGSWAANKLLERQQERLKQALDYIGAQKRRIDILEDQASRLPLDYVLKVDFLREIQEMHENFRQINNKLDKLMEKLLTK
jgi:hypothetical protein